MKLRALYVVGSMTLALAAIALMLMFLSRYSAFSSASDLSRTSLDGRIPENSGGGIKVFARRAISIPFGIDDTLQLSRDGQVINVTGHGECPEGAETFKVNVDVRQESTRAPAKGKTEGACPSGGLITWSEEAVAPGPITFDQGGALACGNAVIHFDKEGALTFRWCKEVTLE